VTTHFELRQLNLGRNALGFVVSQQWARHIAALPGPKANLHSPVSVLLSRLVRHNLHLIQLQHRACHPNLALEYARHALLDGENSRA
jgi:hypothetical protein